MRKLKLFFAACATLVMCGAANAQTWTGNAPAEGTFFLYNVGAEKFINNGDPNEEWGTNAYLQAGFGLDIKLEANNGAYNLNTNVSNGGSSHYLATSTWCDGAATPWTFTAVEGQNNTYTISDGTSYLVANEALNDIVYGASTGDSKSWWKLVSLDDFKTAMQAKAYSATEPMDVSVFIQGRSFARNDGRNSSWTTTHTGGNWTWIGASANKYYGNEAWNNTFSVSQTIENLPDGTYELKCSGFGTNGTTYIFANNTSQAIQTDNTTSYGTNKEAKWKAIHEDNAFAGQTTGKFTLSGGTLNLGLKRETNKSGDWCVYDEFRLYYYGLDLSEFAATLAAAVAEAEAVEGTVPAAAYTTLAAVVTENNKTYTTAAEYTAAANAIVEATNTAKALQTSYARYTSVKTAALAIASSLDTSAADNEANAATTNEDINAAVATLRAAFLDALPDVTVPESGLDVTAVMVDNASVSTNTDFWTIANLSSQGGSAGVCNYGECEFYNRNFKFYQTLALTPGTWEFGVTGFHRAGNHKTYFYAGEDKILIPGVASSVVNNMAQAKDYFDAGNGKVALKFLVEAAQNIEIGIDNQDTETDKWTIFRNFTLKYYGEPDYSVYEAQWTEAVAAAEAALTTYAEFDGFVATEKSALQTAKADVPTAAGLKAGYVAKISALTDATTAYTDACLAFESAKKAIADANAVKENHNFASATATTTFADAIKAISDKYDAGTLTREEAAAAGTTLGVAVSGWQANANGAASAYMNDGFSLNAFTGALYVNTWSVEGASDGTNFLVPFYENYGADANSLATNTFAGNITGLENGLYKVSVWVRARVKNDVDLADATGITINVNDGEAVNAAAGTQVGESRFLIGTFEAEGLVKDGKLNFNVNVLDGNNISWLSFKNVKYTKVRDLTPEEMAVAPTAIALYNGETEVTEAVELTATANTVTLTPSYTPADASEGYITWASSDETVATVVDGVVTGVAPGTATITATSTLDANVSATATVTVSYPESTIPATYETIDGATKTVYTLAQTNLFKNGSFEYPNRVYGWKATSYSTDAVASNFTFTATGGVNDGAYITTSAGGAGAATTIRQAAAVEAGKTYYFAVYTSGKAPSSNNFQYNALFKMSNATTENGVLKQFEWPQGADKTTSEWTKTEYVFTATAENPFVGVRMGWNSDSRFDEFVLAEVTETQTYDLSATAEDYAALQTAIGNAPALGFQADEAAPYNNVEAAKALAAAKAIDPEGENTHDAVVAATNALTAATWTTNTEEVNAVYDGTFAAATNNGAPAGWRMSNSTLGGDYHSRAFVGDDRLSEFNTSNSGFYIRFDGTNSSRGSMYYYGDTEGYTMPLAADTYYRVTVDFAGWGSTGKPLRMNVTGPEGFTAVGQTINTSVQADNADNAPQQFNILFKTAGAGNYVINFQTPGADSNTHAVLISNVMLKKALEDVTITSAGYATYCSEYPLDFSEVEGLTAYTATLDGTEVSFEEVTEAIPANTGVLLKGAAGTYSIPVASSSSEVTSALRGVIEETVVESEGIFVLLNGDNGVGFYKTTATSFTVGAHTAYFPALTADPSRKFIAIDEATAIKAIEKAERQNGEIYNLAGQRVKSAQKGLYIIGGKKVIK